MEERKQRLSLENESEESSEDEDLPKREKRRGREEGEEEVELDIEDEEEEGEDKGDDANFLRRVDDSDHDGMIIIIYTILNHYLLLFSFYA